MIRTSWEQKFKSSLWSNRSELQSVENQLPALFLWYCLMYRALDSYRTAKEGSSRWWHCWFIRLKGIPLAGGMCVLMFIRLWLKYLLLMISQVVSFSCKNMRYLLSNTGRKWWYCITAWRNSFKIGQTCIWEDGCMMWKREPHCILLLFSVSGFELKSIWIRTRGILILNQFPRFREM